MLQVLGPPPSRVRDLNEAKARRKRRAFAIIWSVVMSRLKKTVLVLCVTLISRSAFAFFDPVTISLATWFTTSIAMPVSYALGCATTYSPPIRLFGTERAVYGLDWGSLACHAENVYGMQLSFCGGSFEQSLYGLQLGIIASGYAQEEIPLGDYHLFNIDHCRMNGIQFGTFAAKTAMANGFQLSAIYNEAQTVNGFQIGLVNETRKLHGLQVGLYNEAKRGLGLQVGLVNFTRSGMSKFFPVLNFVF